MLGTWPPALGIFQKLIDRGSLEESRKLADGRRLEFEAIYPLDAAFDTLDSVPVYGEDTHTAAMQSACCIPLAPSESEEKTGACCIPLPQAVASSSDKACCP